MFQIQEKGKSQDIKINYFPDDTEIATTLHLKLQETQTLAKRVTHAQARATRRVQFIQSPGLLTRQQRKDGSYLKTETTRMQAELSQQLVLRKGCAELIVMWVQSSQCL